MSNWVDLDADFGAPILRLLVNIRHALTKEEYRPLRAILSDLKSGPARPLVVENIALFIGTMRRDLKGCTVLAISQPSFSPSFWLAIDVIHPSLKRIPMGMCPPEQRLETCWTCGNPLSLDKSFLRSVPLELSEEEMTDPGEAVVDCDFPIGRGRPDRPMKTVEVCSEACVTAERPRTDIGRIQAIDGVEDDDEVLPPRSLHVGQNAQPSLAQVSGLPASVLGLTHEANQTTHPECLAHHRFAADNAGADRANKPHAECRAEHIEYSDPRPSCGHHCMDYQPEGRHVASFKCPCGAEYRRSGNRWERV